MKTKLLILSAVCIFFVLNACKKSKSTANDSVQAESYYRFVNVDGPTTFVSGGRSVNDIQLYINGKINGNGDSLILNSDRSVFRTCTINYSPLGWTDLSDPRTLGVYGYEMSKRDNNNNIIPFTPSDYHYFPNPTHRIKTGSILNDINFYKWASLPSGSTNVDVKRVDRTGGSILAPQFVQGPTVLKAAFFLEPQTIYTTFLVNKAPTIGIDVSYRRGYLFNGYSNYGIYPDLNTANLTSFYEDNDLQFVVVTDHPDKLKFKDSTAYVRFLNFTPNYTDQALNGNTEDIDVYVAPIFGRTYSVIGYNQIGTEVLAASNLKRFSSATDQPFFAIDVRPWMQSVENRPDSINTFEVLIYRSGESAARGNEAIARGDFLYTNFVDPNRLDNTKDNRIDARYKSWLVRSDGVHYFPSITTVPLFVDNDGATCGFKSIIAFEQAFLNANYVQK